MNSAREHCSWEKSQKVTDGKKKKLKRKRASRKRKTHFPNAPLVQLFSLVMFPCIGALLSHHLSSEVLFSI